MDDTSLFSSLVVSRPAMRGPHFRRAALLALACSLHLAILGTLVLAPLLLPEMVDAPNAKVPEISITQPRVIIVRPRGNSGPPTPGARKGGGPGRRAVQPTVVAVEPPPPNPDSPPLLDPLLAQAQHPVDGLSPGSGDPNGTNGGDGGSSICPTCPGGGGTGSDQDGPPGGLLIESSPNLTNPVLVPSSRALPKYPDLARRARVEGTVILLIVIDRDGSVGEVQVVRSPDQRWGFDLAALEAVKQWRYHPGLLAGRPVAVQASVMVEFVLSR